MQTYPDITNKATDQQYSVVRLCKDNLKDLAFLHSQVYATASNEGYFLKKYNTAYTGVEYVGFLAYTKNNFPVAFYGVIPCFLTYQNKTLLVAQSADTMTHPNYRFKGMFVDLSRRTFNLCKENGIQLVFGFPNQNSYHGAIHKLGWIETETMRCFIIPVNTIPLERICKKLGLQKLYTGYCQMILKRPLPLKGVANSVNESGFAGVSRSGAYLEHKNYNHTKVIEVKDARLWISIREAFIIGDMENIRQENFTDVMNEIKKIAGKLGLKQIQFHCCKGTALHDLFSRAFKAIPSFPVLFQDFGSDIPPDKIKFSFADIDIF
jgi:Acetyltransferase (GNAT) domain